MSCVTSQIRSAFLRRGERKLTKNSGTRTGTRMEFLVPVLAPAHIRFGVKLYLFIFIFIIKRSYFHPARHGVIWQTTPDTIRRGTSTYRYSYSTWFNCLLPDRLSPIYTCTIPAYFPRSPLSFFFPLPQDKSSLTSEMDLWRITHQLIVFTARKSVIDTEWLLYGRFFKKRSWQLDVKTAKPSNEWTICVAVLANAGL